MFDVVEILEKVKKLFSKQEILFIFLLITFYFVTRLIHLTRLPIFTDEGIYIRWAKVAWHDALWRFISLTDGRQPLQTWATIPFLKLFPEDPLFAGRLFSVTTGFGALIGLFSLLYYLFGKRAAYIGAILYIFTPYFLFYDRMALADSAVNAGFIWMLFLTIVLIRTMRLDIALIYGLIAGLVLLTKSTPKIFLISSFLAPLLIVGKQKAKWIHNTVNYWFLFAIVVVLSTVIYNVQRLSPFFHFVSQKNTTFVLTWRELLANPLSLLPHNLWTLPYYVLSEMGWVIGIFAAIGVVLLFKKDRRLSLYLLIWLILPYLIIGAISKVVFPRYLIFLGTSLVIFTSYFLSSLKKWRDLIVTVAILAASVIFFDYTILFRPQLIPFPPVDRGQYVIGITAGWGVSDIIDFARTKSTEKPVILLGEGDFGVIGDMLEATKKQSDTKIIVKGYWPLEKKSLEENQPLLKDNLIYVVFSHRQEFPPDWPIKLIKRYDKIGGEKSSFYFFQLLPFGQEMSNVK